jgi:YgiT-type zinc finger domain-containing protein
MTEPTRLTRLSDELQVWHAAHPESTLSELEEALDAQLDVVRAELLADLVAATPPSTTCPSCGQSLVRRGQQRRTLTTRGAAALTIERAYLTCPACGDGLFPPG